MSPPVPMPGATNGVTRLPYQDVTAAGWPPLRASDAINFTSANAVLLPPGTLLYRVYGGPGGMSGKYWSPAAPPPNDTEARWRGETAVELSWNSATDVAEVAVQGAAVHAWSGTIAPQPAEDTTCRYLPGYILPGGDSQYWVPNGQLPSPQPVGATPWSSTSQPCPPPPSPSAGTPGTGQATPGAGHANHAAQLAHLAQQLKTLAGRPSAPTHLTALADRLSLASLRFSEDLARYDEPDRVARVAHAIQAHLGLRRHVDLDPELPGYAELDAALESVIASAAAFSTFSDQVA